MSMNVHLGQTWPTAAKQHTCSLCGYPIPKGVVHVKDFGIFEGDYYSMRRHTQCHDATTSWDIDDWECCGDDPEGFRQHSLTPRALKEIQNLGKHPLQDIMDALNTQDNRYTSHPMFCVEEYDTSHDDPDDHLWVNVSVCFTLKGAEEYIRDHKHNLGKTRIYVGSYYRNTEMIRIRDWLMNQGVKKEG